MGELHYLPMNLQETTLSLSPEHDVHLAGRDDYQAVSDILASAFTHDPMLNWLCGESSVYSDFFRLEIECLYKKHNLIYINEDKSGAALWLPPSAVVRPSLHWRLFTAGWQLFQHAGFAGLRRALQFDAMMRQWHIQEPHFYLHAVGASLGNQGRGIGSVLLKTGLKACDEQGMPAYLESTNEKNNPLYERFGFEVIGEQPLPTPNNNGPTMWFMKRPKR